MSEFSLHPQLAQDCLFVCDLKLSRVLLMNDCNFPWTILVPRIEGALDVYTLSEENQLTLTQESALLARTMMSLFRGEKMNVAALGNMVPQLHIHHIVRNQGDPAWPKPVWGCLQAVPYTAEEATAICESLATGLNL